MSGNGKGSARRRSQVSRNVVAANWDQTFGKRSHQNGQSEHAALISYEKYYIVTGRDVLETYAVEECRECGYRNTLLIDRRGIEHE